MAVLKFNYGLVYQLLSTTKRTLQLNDWPRPTTLQDKSLMSLIMAAHKFHI